MKCVHEKVRLLKFGKYLVYNVSDFGVVRKNEKNFCFATVSEFSLFLKKMHLVGEDRTFIFIRIF